MDVYEHHLDNGLILATEGNRILGQQLVGLTPAPKSAAAFDRMFDEDGWPPGPGRMPFALAIRPITAATAAAMDLARVLLFLDQGGGIITSDLLCRYILEATSIGTWILRPGLTAAGDTPEDPDLFREENRRARIERAHLTRWLSIEHYRPGQPKGKVNKDAVASFQDPIRHRIGECELVPGVQKKLRLDGTDEEGLGRMSRALTAEVFAKHRKLPDVYTQLSAYGHPNIDSIVEMEGPDGRWRRDAGEMITKLWVGLHLIARAWEMFAVYAGADLQPVDRWREALNLLDASATED